MRKALSLALLAAATTLSQPAFAQEAGTIQVKVLATAVLPDGKVKAIEGGTLAATVAGLGVQTEANDNYVPTVAIEYFATPNVSIETICCTSAHTVSATAPAALAGAQLVDKIHLIPATFTLKYHLGKAGGIRPYVGAGPSYFIFLKDRAGAGATSALTATNVQLDDTFGLAVQAGVDVPVNAAMSVSLDAKRYFMRPDAHFYNAAGTEVLHTKHKLDPWVLSAGVGFKF
ncbi:MAG: OmpW family outer membrane protein [Croceibacterium sp.]